jgi:hypothetical protein
LKKSAQKTFVYWGLWQLWCQNAQVITSFLLLFFKKEALAFFLYLPWAAS